ncbi:hypothetical protein SOCE26_031100 [Sorangium cellulosum]|uniref:PEGA domain-containing protein n=1 Tax=Sorangium cellulosum TaxID=56 RepID=A0A2L0EQU5_SORCE|nr:PEGA domain-containing protein [Sorangium cellulosum]AUX41688.1 hypothetical protein SOCE26_031100 [Sorangium cellulosum]
MSLRAWALVAAALAPRWGSAAEPPPVAGSPTAAPPPGTDGAAAAKAEAAARFQRGLELLRERAWSGALAEFLASRRLYPTWSATTNAAYCLKQLEQLDEALDLFEILLRDFPDTLPARAKEAAQREVVALRERVGTIEIQGAEPGAALSIDGRSRGEYPPLAPLRVAGGRHVVRVYKEGFEPFEAGVTVAGGQTARVAAPLRPLIVAGRLRVTERSGWALDVVVDGNTVGTTPWEGPIAVGEHTVMLRSAQRFGTPPAPVSIRRAQTTSLSLAAEPLDAAIRVTPSPADASVAIDGIFVGRGTWEGRLRPGAHRIELVADGYFGAERQVALDRGGWALVAVALARDPGAPRWRDPPRFTLELGGALALSPTLGGDIAERCGARCSQGLAAGGYGVFHGGYEVDLGTRFGFGLAAGHVRLGQSTRGRSAEIRAVGIAAPNVGEADESIQLRGVLAGAWAGLGFGGRYPVRLRLGAGAVIGSVADARTGTFTTSRGERYGVGPAVQVPSAAWFYLDPEVRVGVRLGERVELSAGVDVLVLVGGAARWDAGQAINAAGDGYGQFDAEALTSPVLFAVLPGIGARYHF